VATRSRRRKIVLDDDEEVPEALPLHHLSQEPKLQASQSLGRVFLRSDGKKFVRADETEGEESEATPVMNFGAKRSSNIGVSNFGGTCPVEGVNDENYEEEKKRVQEEGSSKGSSVEVSLDELKELLGES